MNAKQLDETSRMFFDEIIAQMGGTSTDMTANWLKRQDANTLLMCQFIAQRANTAGFKTGLDKGIEIARS